MTWDRGRESSRIPARIKRQVRARDNNECQLRYPCCTGHADQFDHILGVKELGISRYNREAADPNNLRCVCTPCHKRRTQAQAHAACRAWKRQPQKHPGLM